MPPTDNVFALRPHATVAHAQVAARTPLWELDPACHCPLIGVALGSERLREVLDDLFDGRSQLDDFELHAGAVRECATRNRVSERLQDELDRLHVEAVTSITALSTVPALADAWVRAAGRGDAAPMLWAVLTHPACSAELGAQLLRDIHMIQHRALGAVRAHVEAGDRLAAENARLRDELADARREGERLRDALAVERARPTRGPRAWRRFFPGAA